MRDRERVDGDPVERNTFPREGVWLCTPPTRVGFIASAQGMFIGAWRGLGCSQQESGEPPTEIRPSPARNLSREAMRPPAPGSDWREHTLRRLDNPTQ